MMRTTAIVLVVLLPQTSRAFGPLAACHNSGAYYFDAFIKELVDGWTASDESNPFIVEALEAALKSWKTLPCSYGGAGRTHESITRVACERFLSQVIGLTESTPEIDAAIREIVLENAKVDLDQEDAAKHFDAESLVEGQKRIEAFRVSLIAALERRDARSARKQLGSLLHTLQDFYTHSTWVEMGNRERTQVHPWIGRVDGTRQARRPPAGILCEPGNPDDCLPFLLPLGIGFLLGDAAPSICRDVSTDRILTTGHYRAKSDSPDAPPGRCRHGGWLDNGTVRPCGGGFVTKDCPTGPPRLMFDGINKDTAFFFLSPHFEDHFAAALLAEEATFRFLCQLLTDAPKATCEQMAMLFNVANMTAITILASSGAELEGSLGVPAFGRMTGFEQNVSINNRGDVSFIAKGDGAGDNEVVAAAWDEDFRSGGDRKPRRVSLAQGRFSVFQQINDSGEIVTQQTISSGGTFLTRVRQWDPIGTFNNIMSAGVVAGLGVVTIPIPFLAVQEVVVSFLSVFHTQLSYDVVYSPSINNAGEIVMAANGATGGERMTSLLMAPSKTTDPSALFHVKNGSLSFRPMADDAGGAVVRLDGDDGRLGPVVRVDWRKKGIEMIPTAVPFLLLNEFGRMPGVSDDGMGVVFYAVDKDGSRGPHFVLRDGKDGFGNKWYPLADPLDVEDGFVGLFEEVESQRINVNRIGDTPIYRVLAIGRTEPRNGEPSVQALFTFDVNPTEIFERAVGKPQRVRAVGDRLPLSEPCVKPPVTSAITDLRIYDSLNTRGEIAYWARLENGQEVVVRERTCPSVLNLDELASEWEADPRELSPRACTPVPVSSIRLMALPSAATNAPILRSFEFGQLQGRPGHQGLFPIEGDPVAGSPLVAKLRMAGSAGEVGLQLRTRAGQPIENVSLRRGTGTETNIYIGELTAPKVPFQVVIVGETPSDEAIPLGTSELFTSKTIEVIPSQIPNLVPGDERVAVFEARNHGAMPVTCEFQEASGESYVVGVTPASALIQPGGVVAVAVNLSIPPETRPGFVFSLKLIATPAGDPSGMNYAGAPVTVNPPPDVVAPEISLQRFPGSIILRWNGDGVLQSASDVAGPWVDDPSATSPHPVSLDGSTRFFRVRR